MLGIGPFPVGWKRIYVPDFTIPNSPFTIHHSSSIMRRDWKGIVWTVSFDVREAVFTGQGDIEKTMIEQLNNSCLAPVFQWRSVQTSAGFSRRSFTHCRWTAHLTAKKKGDQQMTPPTHHSLLLIILIAQHCFRCPASRSKAKKKLDWVASCDYKYVAVGVEPS